MKQFRLLLTLFALILGWTNVSGQTWTASEVGTGNFYLYNVGTGQFLTRGNGYGTQASVSANSALTLIVEEYSGAYKLRTNVNGDGKGLERLADPVIYTDQSASKNSTWTFTKVADASNGPVYTIVSAENHGGGAGSYMTANADNTIVSPADAVTDDYGHWQLLKSWITNSIPVNDTNGWTVSLPPTTFDSGNVCAEFWNKSGASIKQTLQNLPAGSYELIAVALTREGMTATLNAGSNTMSIATVSNTVVNGRGEANTWFNAGNGVNRLEFTHAGGNLEIGLTADNANGDHWLVWRSFVLIYKGLDLSELKAALQAQIDAVPALEGTTTAAAYNAAKNYADGIDIDALTTEEAISTASNELASLVNAAIALQTNYTRYNTIKTAAKTIATSLDTTTPDAAFDAATTNDAIEDAIASLRTALLAELPNIEISEGSYVDVTNALVDNPSVRQNTDYWTIEGTPNGNFSFGKVSYEECEFYNNNFKFYQTLALSAGTWEFGVTGFHRGGQGEFDTYFYAGDDKILIPGVESSTVNTMAEAKAYFDDGNGKVALKFALDGTKTIEIGIDNQDTRTDMWTIFRDFTLKYYGTAIDLTPYKEALQEAITAANVIAEELAGKVPTAAIEHFTDVINENNKEFTSVADYQAAKAAVEAAATAIQALQEPYNRYQIIKTAVAALDDDTSAFIEDVRINTTEAENIAEAAVTEEGIYEAITKLKEDAVTFLRSITVKENKKIDITNIWAINADFEEGSIDGWMNDGSTYAGIQDNKEFDNTQGNYYAERWHAAGTIDLNQTVLGIPSGNYEISAYLYTDTPDGIFYANDTQIPFSNSQNYSITIYVDETSTIKFGAKCTLTESTWICMDDFKIALVGVDHSRYNSVKEAVLAIASDLNITEAETLNANAKKAEDVEAAVKAIRETLLAELPNIEIAEGAAIDLTNAIIDNPTVSENVDYWNAENVVKAVEWGTGPTTNFGETEFYQCTFDFNQLVKGLPMGTYEFGVTGFHRAGNHATYFYAGEDKVLIPGVESSVVNSMAEAKTYFDNGNGMVALKFALEGESNDIKIGIVNNDTQTDRWTIFRDFTLKYFGSQIDLSIYENAWNEAVAAAEAAIAASPNVTGVELAAVNAAKDDVPEANKASYLEKTEALTNATQALIAAAPAYNTFVEYKSFVNALTLPYADQAKKPSTESIENPTSAEDATTKSQAILVSLRPYFESNALAEGVEGSVNMTDKIGQAYAPASAADITAWTITDNSEEYDPTIRSNEPFTEADGSNGGPYYDGGDLWNTTYIANYKQEITLPAGKYMLTITARASQGTKKFELYAGENTLELTKIGAGVGTGIFDRGWNDESVEFTVDTEKAVEIGVNIEQDNPYNWYSFSRFRLVQLEGGATKKGDVNGDTKVDIADITALVNALQKSETPEAGKIDSDDDVDADDVKALVELILHNQ